MTGPNGKHNPEVSAEAEAPAVAPDGIWTHLRVSVIATLVLAVIVCGLYPLVVWGLSQVIFHDKANGSLITNKDGQVIGSRLIGQSFSDAKYFHPRPSAAGNGYDPTASGGSNLGPMSAKLINGTTKPSTLPATQPGAAPLSGPTVVDNDGIKLRILTYCEENSLPYQFLQDGKPADTKPYKTAKGEWDQVKLIMAFNDSDHPLTIVAGRPIPADSVTASASGLDPHISPDNAALQAARVAGARKATLADVQRLIEAHTEGPDLGVLGEPAVNVVTLNLALDKEYPVSNR